MIVALHHEQDIWKMGGLRERMPKTYWTFLIGTMALCGVPLFSGFFSKEAILDAALETNLLLFLVAVLVALLTTFYMTRLFVVAFMGEPRSAQARGAVESPSVMTVPLILLAELAVSSGYFNAHAPNPLVLAASLVVLVFGMLVANSLYSGAKTDPLPAWLGRLAKALRDLPSKFRLAMTGTPVENSLGDLWALLDYVNKRVFSEALATYLNRKQKIHEKTLTAEDAKLQWEEVQEAKRRELQSIADNNASEIARRSEATNSGVRPQQSRWVLTW